MNATELKAILTGLGPGLNAAIAKSTQAATAPLLARIEELDAKIAAVPEGKQGAQGIPGDPGPPVETAVLLNMIAEAVALAVAEIPPAQDGRDGAPGDPGKDGTSITLQDVQPWISEEIGRQFALVLDKSAAVRVDEVAEFVKSMEEGIARELGALTGGA